MFYCGVKGQQKAGPTLTSKDEIGPATTIDRIRVGGVAPLASSMAGISPTSPEHHSDPYLSALATPWLAADRQSTKSFASVNGEP